MGMVDEQLDGCPMARLGLERLLVLAQVFVKLDELERLVLNVGEEVVVADEGEDERVPELEIVGQRLAGLAIQDVATENKISGASARCVIVSRTVRSAPA